MQVPVLEWFGGGEHGSGQDVQLPGLAVALKEHILLSALLLGGGKVLATFPCDQSALALVEPDR